MNIEALTALQGASLNTGYSFAAMSRADIPENGFDSMVANGLTKVNAGLLSTEVDAQKLAIGNVENLHQIMINMEETKASFQLMLQVRNRLLDAYQEVMRMQI